jgi:hypothetical protein
MKTRKLTRKSLNELEILMPKLSEIQQKTFVGGGDGSYLSPYTWDEYTCILSNGTWFGGYVEGFGYIDSGTSYGSGSYEDSGSYYDTSGSYGINDSGSYGSGSYGDDNQTKWNNIQPQISSQLAAYGYNISQYSISILDAVGRSHIDSSNNIFLKDSFFNMTVNDQVSVLIHEFTHTDCDKAYDPNFKITILQQDFTFSSTMSNDVFEYYKSINFGSSIEEIVTNLQDAYYGNLSAPQKYLNEIFAYEEEKRLFPNVSEKYRREREGKIYFYQQLYRIAQAGLGY